MCSPGILLKTMEKWGIFVIKICNMDSHNLVEGKCSDTYKTADATAIYGQSDVGYTKSRLVAIANHHLDLTLRLGKC